MCVCVYICVCAHKCVKINAHPCKDIGRLDPHDAVKHDKKRADDLCVGISYIYIYGSWLEANANSEQIAERYMKKYIKHMLRVNFFNASSSCCGWR